MRFLLNVRFLFATAMLLGSATIGTSQAGATTFAVTATIGVGSDPFGVAVNPTTNVVYVTNGSGNSVSVINGATNTVTATIDVGDPGAVAVNPTTNVVYVANFSDNSISVIYGATNTVTTSIGVGSNPY